MSLRLSKGLFCSGGYEALYRKEFSNLENGNRISGIRIAVVRIFLLGCILFGGCCMGFDKWPLCSSGLGLSL